MTTTKNNQSPLSLFVDTDTFLAMLNVEDPNHQRAVAIYFELENQNVRYQTSNLVISEAVTIINRELGHVTALEFIKGIRDTNSPFPVTWVTPDVEENAIRIFSEQSSKNVSFVDCTNMALLDLLHINGIFSFDSLYRINGYNLVEDILKTPIRS